MVVGISARDQESTNDLTSKLELHFPNIGNEDENIFKKFGISDNIGLLLLDPNGSVIKVYGDSDEYLLYYTLTFRNQVPQPTVIVDLLLESVVDESILD